MANPQTPRLTGMTFESDCFVNGELVKAGTHISFMTRWIPVTERLPDDGESVMIAMKDASEPVWIGFHEGERWFSDDAVEQRVTHWMPIIEGPPRG